MDAAESSVQGFSSGSALQYDTDTSTSLPPVPDPSETLNPLETSSLPSVVPSVSVEGTPSVSPWTFPHVAFNSFPLSIPVLGSLAAAILLVIVLAFTRRRRSATKGSSILLTGPSDGGKTAIHSALVYERVLPSHTSLQTNVSLITLPSTEKQRRILRLVDIPGHPRIRDQFKDHLCVAKAVVFVVDASTVARSGAAVAEHLHYILHALTSLPPSQSPPSLVILAHKCDLLATSSSNAALAVSRVRTILERELEKRRASQAGGVGVGQLGEDESTDTELGGLECVGPGGSGFKFKDWEGGEIEILGGSVRVVKGDQDTEKTIDGLEELKRWLNDLQ